ncbi:tRNA 5-methoxyuridine(34)/uridine 5-oxyacetic acid(34) synthase CmoB [Sulfurospirillum arcachonense]|uniref:tRNA 5-methoxyuridine(34)/uridine 5-oxyacetic acid(34) synthase CmoB n=1 Tax=Sulfurospirillum arcachonense TaxID=57666 RepID=UPI00046A380C|nr:tRNA 5-methoxyuridine(34)/uridine 5-oxyacetic acid(34) synthase CmoB [Sulfurospirillum arcachonense]
MNLNNIRNERQKCFGWKDNKVRKAIVDNLPEIKNVEFSLGDTLNITNSHISVDDKEKIHQAALGLRPWRKGPFQVFDTFIDTEWKSYIKYNLIRPYFNLKDKIVGDIGCNNGYYLFRMLEDKPKRLIGFDPSALCKMQFDFINHFAKTDIKFELLGVEHLPFYEHKFDILFCLGVLYHRSDPVNMLKELYKSLNKNGEVILDTFMIDGDEPHALCPGLTYSKIPNIYFVPTIKALENWSQKAKFSSFEVLEVKKTELNEQRRTDWILGESLGDFLDPNNLDITIEGYPAPKRVYIKLKK